MAKLRQTIEMDSAMSFIRSKTLETAKSILRCDSSELDYYKGYADAINEVYEKLISIMTVEEES